MPSYLSPSRSLGLAKIISTSPQKPISGQQNGAGQTTSKQVFEFQFWPESLQDTKAVDYAKKTVLGSSHPLYQFVSGGERSLSFTAVFSRDLAPAAQTINDGRGQYSTPSVQIDKYNVDINAAVWALRRFLYPSYGTGDLKAFPPEFIQLQLDNTAIGGYTRDGADDIMDCIMSRCDVTYHAWFPSGVPRYATVDLEFLETVQGDQSNPADIGYVDRMVFAEAWNKYQNKQGSLARNPNANPNKSG